MGTLKPGASYIYERDGATVYARESGADPSTRQVVGYDYSLSNDPTIRNMADKYFLEVEWANILKAAQNNSTLHDAIERVKILYHLSEKNAKQTR